MLESSSGEKSVRQSPHPLASFLILCRPLFKGVFSSQTYSRLSHVALSVPMSGAGQWRNVQCKKPHEERFL